MLESWLQLVQSAPQNRPEVGPLHSIAFLIKYLDEIEEPKIEFGSAIKNQDIVGNKAGNSSPTNAN